MEGGADRARRLPAKRKERKKEKKKEKRSDFVHARCLLFRGEVL